MDLNKMVMVAKAEGIAKGFLEQTDTGIKLTPLGQEYSEKLWGSFSDLDKLMLAGLIPKILSTEIPGENSP